MYDNFTEEKAKHDQTIAKIVLTGVVLTVTIAILGSVYNHQKNVDRDRFLIERCNSHIIKTNDTSEVTSAITCENREIK